MRREALRRLPHVQAAPGAGAADLLGFAGSITAAMFLRRFVTAAKTWLHCDIYAWNQTTRPGRPEGAECQAARALYALLTTRYG